MKDELLFISNCFNMHYNKWASKKIQYLAKKRELDWNFILKKLTQSDIAPLAFYNLSIIKNNKIPKWFLNSLDDTYKNTIIKNIYIWKELHKLINLLSRENISIMALKGIFMADIIYKKIGVRPLVDIDILIKKSDTEKVKTVLQENGYTEHKWHPGGTLCVQSSINSKIPIELHHGLSIPDELLLPENFMWAHAEKKEKTSAEILYPSIEDGIIYAALHFFHHISDTFVHNAPFPSLKSILDIHDILSRKRDEIDWDYLLEFSRKYRIRHILYLSLILSKIYFKTAIPAKAINKIKPPFIRNRIIFIFSKKYILIQGEKINDNYLKTIKCVYYSLFEKPYFKQRFFVPINDFAKEHYLPCPSVKTYCLYLLRPFLLLFYLKKCS